MPDTYTKLRYHIVFGTKQRLPLITAEVRDDLYSYLGGILARHGGILLAVGGMPDHVHLLAGLNTTRSLADIMQRVKANSSRWMNERAARTEPFAWQVGYGAFSVSESQIGVVRTYILRQEEHHRKVSFQDELKAILRKHGFEADPKFLAG
jgi:REP element-mobilizing transposase RayT